MMPFTTGWEERGAADNMHTINKIAGIIALFILYDNINGYNSNMRSEKPHIMLNELEGELLQGKGRK